MAKTLIRASKSTPFLVVLGVFIVTLAAGFVFISNPISAITRANPSVCNNGGNYNSSTDYVNIGDTASEDGHNLSGWSGPWNWGGNYGGGDNGTLKMVIEQRIESCSEDDRSAFFTLNAGADGAKLLTLRHLDGSSKLDSFDIYVNGQFIDSYTDTGDGEENWVTSSFSLDEIMTSELNIEIRATDDIWNSCWKWGQLAI